MSYIYIASPYSSHDPVITEKRVEAVSKFTAYLVNKGHVAFSPIVHCHPLVKYNLPGDFDFWQKYDHAMISSSATVYVLMLDGWEKSLGVLGEMKYAKKIGKPVQGWVQRQYPDGSSLWFTETDKLYEKSGWENL